MMRPPRVRLTIGRLMVAVFAVGVALWAVLIARPQIVAEQQALAGYRQALLVREVAEYAIKEYVEGDYKQDKATYLGQIALARSDKERAIDRLEWSKRKGNKGLLPNAPDPADRLTRQQADFDLEQAQTQLKVLEGYTKQERIKPLQIGLAKARAAESSAFAHYRVERSKRWWWVLAD